MLDLGAWMAMQSVVEKEHFQLRKNPNALWQTMQRAWEILMPVKLANIYARWKLVLDLIIEDEGGDRLIESRRGKKSLYTNPSDEAEELSEDDSDDDGDVERSVDEEEQDTIDEIDWGFYV